MTDKRREPIIPSLALAGWTTPYQVWFIPKQSSEAKEWSMTLRFAPLAASFVLALGVGFGGSAPAEAGKGAAIAGGIIAGAAIGAAVSSSVNQPRTVYVPVPVAAPQPQAWGQVFSPIPHINCYPAQRACYNANGAYNGNWTYKIYAR
ncbi:MAG TPA: hypothetical protein VIG52_09870 [Methyloceanibacter sp.]